MSKDICRHIQYLSFYYQQPNSGRQDYKDREAIAYKYYFKLIKNDREWQLLLRVW